MSDLTHAQRNNLAIWHGPGERTAYLRRVVTSLRLILVGPDMSPSSWHNQWYALKDSPQIRSHLRAMALDWCAHGVSPTGPIASDTGPKRGAMSLATANRLVAYDLYWILLRALMRVRETRGPGWPREASCAV